MCACPDSGSTFSPLCQATKWRRNAEVYRASKSIRFCQLFGPYFSAPKVKTFATGVSTHNGSRSHLGLPSSNFLLSVIWSLLYILWMGVRGSKKRASLCTTSPRCTGACSLDTRVRNNFQAVSFLVGLAAQLIFLGALLSQGG